MSARRRWIAIAVMALSLVFAQSLGALHRVAHNGHAQVSIAADSSSTGQGWLQALFAAHDHGGGACDLFDHALHGDALTSIAALVVPSFEPLAPAQVHRHWHWAAQSAGFLARGPPRI